MNIMHKLAEDAIDIILAGCDDWIDDNQYHDFEGDYDWSDDDMCALYFRVDGKYIGSWDVDIADIEDVNTLNNISAEVEAAVSGMERSEYVDDSGIDSRTGRKAGVPADFDGEDDEWDIENNKPFDSYYKESSSNIKENWQDDWVEPTIDPNPIDNINGLNIYKGTNQYGEEAYYLFLEDEDPEPGYEEWQAETLEIAREWASSYELAEADDFDDEVKLNKNLQDLNEKLAPLKESAFDNDFILNIVKMGYETGYQIFDSYEDFIEDEEVQDIDDKEAAWDFYCNLIDMGPAGFYEEYKDELDFNEDFINKYDNDVINEQCKKMPPTGEKKE